MQFCRNREQQNTLIPPFHLIPRIVERKQI